MSVPIGRELVTQAIVVLGAAIGGWVVLIDPRVEALRAVEAEIAAHESRAARVDQERVQRIADRAVGLRLRCGEIETMSRLGRDSAGLFSRIMALAQENRLEVKNLQPQVQEMAPADKIGLTRIDLSIEGEYERVAWFLESLGTVEAFLRPASIQITPVERDGRQLAALQLGAEALSFRIPREVTELRKVNPS